MYGYGSRNFHNKLEIMKDEGTVRSDANIQIRPDVSALENFLYSNKLTGNSRRIAPLTFLQQPFVTFSEREMAVFFWKREVLKKKPVQMGMLDNKTITSVNDLDAWVSGKQPGFIIKNFIADVAPQGLTSRQRKRAGHRCAVKLWSLDQIQDHLDLVKNEWLDPMIYAEKGYVLRRSIKTDDFEFNCSPSNSENSWMLPPKLTSTVGGVDYYLQEVRNVITSEENVARLWPGHRPENIKILTFDGGKACVFGAFADIPKESFNPTTIAVLASGVDENGVSQSGVYQPTFRFRRWLELEKQIVSDGEHESIADIESHLPALKGQGASVINYLGELQKVEQRLLTF
ncbi:hypothetical protein EC957_006160 [Mortierella hygrophila]|uniref:Uncharacterized protein n=1 Tax=Mortierella hygrophila TaxID=979708 RepID=A0A9P6JZ96_9FUNG|nr:hypothetical protein EC957_006160 [Mortierella hygrophila]